MEQERELLKKMRGHMAYKKGVEPYVIFNDENLEALLEARPQSIEELGKVKGFPADGARVSKWGQAIVDVFTRAEKISDFDVEVDDSGDVVVSTQLKMMQAF